ncbi:hypothetical protein FRB96_004308 [Tulasnella sp. 330]|nr:hypothetical protein FRB96_004308 [Tulasnella sp. 330]
MPLPLEAASTDLSTVTYLRSLPAIRDRCSRVYELAKQGKLEYFDYHPEKEKEVVDFCAEIIQRDFGTNYHSIPPHSRWRHLDAGKPRIQPLIDSWKAASPQIPDLEIAKRLIDLFLVSVLLDAGAGNQWRYKVDEQTYARSEGLAVASYDIFVQGVFSDDPEDPFRVDAAALERLNTEKVSTALQVSESNPMNGVQGRSELLINVAQALRSQKLTIGKHQDFLLGQSRKHNGKTAIHVSSLFGVLIEGLATIWPASRSSLSGVALGDVWPCGALAESPSANSKAVPENVKFSPGEKRNKRSSTAKGDDLVPFHKLTQWITYSLIEPIEKVLGWEVEGMEDMTGLPEYRNGGLLVDLGVLTIRNSAVSSYFSPGSSIPKLPPSHSAIIEWRAMTVIELDRIADGIRTKLGYQLKLAQVLESATWKGGREIAKQKRPETGGPPIEIESDGTDWVAVQVEISAMPTIFFRTSSASSSRETSTWHYFNLSRRFRFKTARRTGQQLPGAGPTARSFNSAAPCHATHYDALQLDKTASKHQIKSSFYKLSKELHPDRNPSASQETKDRYLAASAAYNVLVDDRRRRAYDRSLDSQGQRSHTSHTSQSHHYTPDLTRRARATHAWDHSRRKSTQPPPPHTRSGAGAHHYYSRAPGSTQNSGLFSGRTMSGGRNMTDKGFTKYEKDLADEERVRNDSSLWRYLQVATLIAGVTALASGIAR